MEQLLTYVQENSGSSSSFSTIWYVIGVVGLWKMFEKAGEPGWTGLIPFYNYYKLCDKVMGRPWYWVRLFVAVFPLIGWIAAFYFAYQIGLATARAYGKPDGWAWGYTFLAPVFWIMTGFDSSSYYGPYGGGDTRTGEARQARTVDFDVVKNEPVKEEPAAERHTATAAAEESEVEFEFNQDITE